MRENNLVFAQNAVFDAMGYFKTMSVCVSIAPRRPLALVSKWPLTNKILYSQTTAQRPNPSFNYNLYAQ